MEKMYSVTHVNGSFACALRPLQRKSTEHGQFRAVIVKIRQFIDLARQLKAVTEQFSAVSNYIENPPSPTEREHHSRQKSEVAKRNVGNSWAETRDLWVCGGGRRCV